MKKIQAYKCDHCIKILQTNSGMGRHEKKCFKNPASKSCITCIHLDTRVDQIHTEGRPLTKYESDLINKRIEGTCYDNCDTGPDGLFEGDKTLKDEYQYIYDVVDYDPHSYCNSQRKRLNKLQTECEHWSVMDEYSVKDVEDMLNK